MKLDDIPPEKARDFLRQFLDRNREREDGRGFKTVLHMSRDEALNLWAAQKWLEAYREWGVGIETTDVSIDDAKKFLGGLVAELKHQAGAEQMTVTITERGRPFIAAAELHLDRYAMHRSFPDKQSNGKWKGKR